MSWRTTFCSSPLVYSDPSGLRAAAVGASVPNRNPIASANPCVGKVASAGNYRVVSMAVATRFQSEALL